MRPTTTAALWTVFTVAAVASGLGAVTVVRNAITSPSARPMTQAEVVTELGTWTAGPSPTPSGARPTSASPRPSHSRRPTSGATTGGQSTTGPSKTPTRTSSPPAPSPAATTQAPAGVTRTLASRGGTVVATCTGPTVYLSSWSPAAGYRVDEASRGPAAEVEVSFRGPDEVQLVVRCTGGVPTSQVEVRSDGS